MSGKIVIKPIYATITDPQNDEQDANSSVLKQIGSYCKFSVGSKVEKTSVVKREGKISEWKEEIIILEAKEKDKCCHLQFKEKAKYWFDGCRGETKIDLEPIMSCGKMTQWFHLKNRKNLTAEILLDITYEPYHQNNQISII